METGFYREIISGWKPSRLPLGKALAKSVSDFGAWKKTRKSPGVSWGSLRRFAAPGWDTENCGRLPLNEAVPSDPCSASYLRCGGGLCPMPAVSSCRP
ncbi:hypothetical protein TRIP_B330617 [uncultured Desulfatiglans sp.]|nr:hypothetical protein TRIP_B330617 [uncultured Desulfatiglans sp.]